MERKDDIKQGHFYESVRGLIDKIIVEAEKGSEINLEHVHSLREVVLGVVHKTQNKFEAIFEEVENLKDEIALEVLSDQDLNDDQMDLTPTDKMRLKSYYGALNKILNIIRHDTGLTAAEPSTKTNANFNPMDNPLMKLSTEAQFLFFKDNLRGLYLAGIINNKDYDKFIDAYFVYPGKKVIALKEKIKVDDADKNDIVSLVYKVTAAWNFPKENNPVSMYIVPQILCHSFSCFIPNYSSIRNIYTKMSGLPDGPKTKQYFA